MRDSSIITIYDVLLFKKIKHDLLNIIKLCYKGYTITFDTLSCLIKYEVDNERVFKGYRVHNVYVFSGVDTQYVIYFYY